MKKIKLIIAFIIFISIVANLACFPGGRTLAADDPDIQANAALLVEVSTGKVLYEKNADAEIYPASTTKIMTLLLACEAVEKGEVALNTIVVVGNDAFSDVTADGSNQKLLEGEELSFQDLLYCAAVSSANEACNIIGKYLEGSITSFVARMNNRAYELGCKNTHFANAHGLPNENHHTTARDLYIITAHANTMDLFRTLMETVSYAVPATNLSPERKLATTNRLLVKDGPYYYSNVTGTKTGYTALAGHCLVATANKEDMEFISVVMGCDAGVIDDGTTQVRSFSETKRLLQWGFASFEFRVVLDTKDLITEIPVLMGDGADTVVLRPQSQIVALMDKSTPDTDLKRDFSIYTPESGKLTAPVNAGDVYGDITVTLRGERLGTAKLVANTNITLLKTAYIQSEISRVLKSGWVKLVAVFLFVMFAMYITFAVTYNIKRRKKRLADQAAVKAQVEYLRSRPTTGKSFEDIEDMYAVKAADSRGSIPTEDIEDYGEDE